MSHIKKYLENAISKQAEKDVLFQRRRALARLVCNPTLQGVSKELMHTTTRQIPETCYQLDEKRFCQLLLSTEFYGRLNTVEGLEERVAIINGAIGEALHKQREREAVEMYLRADPMHKVRGTNDSRIAMALMNLSECEAYDPEVMDEPRLGDLMAATLPLRENGKVPTTQTGYDDLAILWFYLGMWHGKPISAAMMNQAFEEMTATQCDNWALKLHEFGMTNHVGSARWGEAGTPCYWDGSKYMTPYAANEAGDLIVSAAQDAGSFSRDAMCDAEAIARRFEIPLATAVLK